ncbi:FGGY-family carbohydrate kinase [Pseudobacter ginsenosidimutans]|uniref:Sugar (Pentulose or hexulose) kinase n=1 Tax=Pseudobacter ginsenosidimutans TaxID=661488 RepID=A0A4Q7MX80_9BACT|nr:FGGY-family carbohydrate kinase [Pseudobacter ginsenosidimutans]QEC41527.1 carbohydrate kinase [Pseudobacter ginsenosidimutans]RZS71690.1 sugar (pentulose or hexulose) kinase [Pseudobacter ginsenosidimutans]
MSEAYFIGIDIGTQGARVVMLDETGRQLGAKEEVFPLTEDSREEQSPELWWECCCRLIPALVKEVKDQAPMEKIKAVAVTSTSGTIIPLDQDFNPLHNAIMYSDPRSAQQASFCKAIAEKNVQEGYTAFNASSGLPKMRWFLETCPEKTEQLYKFIHASDFITGRLSGQYDITDYTNAMKSGYDLHKDQWPGYIAEQIGIRREWLQEVKPSGEPIGVIRKELAKQFGLPETLIVTTGMTDGCASQVASGAVSPGQWNTTIGTTLVIKGVTKQSVNDPSGAIYNHRHPAGYWMPGGASNTGADWVSKLFGGQDLQNLGKEAALRLPAASLAWPLLQKGERFPFVSPQAVGFWPEGDEVEKFTACMEGVAFIERFAYERIALLSGEKIEKVFSAGGGSNSDTWLLIRSSVLKVPVCKMKNVSGAAGAAILAASRSYYDGLQSAAAAMVTPELTVQPSPELVNAYDQKYKLFIEELQARKILN